MRYLDKLIPLFFVLVFSSIVSCYNKIPSSPPVMKETKALCVQLKNNDELFDVYIIFDIGTFLENHPTLPTPENLYDQAKLVDVNDIDIEKIIAENEPIDAGGFSSQMTAYLYYLKYNLNSIAIVTSACARESNFITVNDFQPPNVKGAVFSFGKSNLRLFPTISSFCAGDTQRYRNLPTFDGSVYFLNNNGNLVKTDSRVEDVYRSIVKEYFQAHISDFEKTKNVPFWLARSCGGSDFSGGKYDVYILDFYLHNVPVPVQQMTNDLKTEAETPKPEQK